MRTMNTGIETTKAGLPHSVVGKIALGYHYALPVLGLRSAINAVLGYMQGRRANIYAVRFLRCRSTFLIDRSYPDSLQHLFCLLLTRTTSYSVQKDLTIVLNCLKSTQVQQS